MLILCLVALGGYFAATEGVMTALAGAVLPEKLQASGIGILITVVSIGSLLSSLAFGALWFAIGLQSAVLIFAAALALAIARRGAAAAARPAGARCMDSRSKKILAALVVALRRRRRRLRRRRRARARARRPPTRSPSAGEVLADSRPDGARGRPASSRRLNGRVFVVDDGKVQRRSGDLACERVYYAAGRGHLHGRRALGGRLHGDGLRLEAAAAAHDRR